MEVFQQTSLWCVCLMKWCIASEAACQDVGDQSVKKNLFLLGRPKKMEETAIDHEVPLFLRTVLPCSTSLLDMLLS